MVPVDNITNAYFLGCLNIDMHFKIFVFFSNH